MLTRPKEGINAGVGNEMGEAMGWLMRRTKRVEELLAQPEVMDYANRLAEHIDRFVVIEDEDVRDLDVTIPPVPTKSYIPIVFSGVPCGVCGGTGYVPSGVSYCPRCNGTGLQIHH